MGGRGSSSATSKTSGKKPESDSEMSSHGAKEIQFADELDKVTNEYKKALNNKEILNSELSSIRYNQYIMYLEQIKRTEDRLSEAEQRKLANEMAFNFSVQTRVNERYIKESQRVQKLYSNMLELQIKSGHIYKSPLLDIET